MLPIPSDPASVTAAWLSEVLNTDVADVEILDSASATNQRLRVRVTYRSGMGPESLFVKLAPTDPVHRELIGASRMGRREAQFYNDVAPTTALRVPGCRFAGSTDNGDFALVLEDLAAQGCRFSNGSWGVSADQALGALEGLAHFHARFGSSEERDGVAPWLAEPAMMSGGLIAPLLASILDEHRDELTTSYVAAGQLYVEHHDRIDELWNGGPQTLVHGDPHIGNVFLDGDQVGFFDWGLSRVSSPLWDASYFLTMTVDPEERRRAEPDLLRGYVDCLEAAGGPALGFDQAWFAHRVQAAYTVLATFLVFMPTYAGEVAETLGADLLRRAQMALDDLEVVEALQLALSEP